MNIVYYNLKLHAIILILYTKILKMHTAAETQVCRSLCGFVMFIMFIML